MLKNTRPQRAPYKREASDFLSAFHPSVFGAVAAALIALLSAIPAARAAIINVVDVIPNSDSAEALQNSEPSLAVNPLNTSQMIAGSFGNFAETPFFKSTNGGTIWSDYGNLSPVVDKSIAWRRDGVAALATTLPFLNIAIQTFSGTITAANFGAPIGGIFPDQLLDQPWIRTGPSGQTYVTYNNVTFQDPTINGGRTASVNVSSNNGVNFAAPVTLETVNPPGGTDAPSVRSAVNGSTVYAAFTRLGTEAATDGGSIFNGSQVVVTKSTNSGVSFPTSVNAATTTGYFSELFTYNTPLTLGQERTGSDIAIAVDPNNANRVVVAYGDRTGAGLLQLKVIESTDGGATWTNKFTTSAAVRSALPGLSILTNGGVGLLYASYDPVADTLSQHLVTTTDDFATTTDSLLGTETNNTPTSIFDFDPYIGDFYDLTSVDGTFYGIFSGLNLDNGNLLSGADYPSATFQRCFTGTERTASFTLCNNSGGTVGLSIDPFVFSFSPVPEPATVTLLGAALIGLAVLRRRRR
jgi:hypothetical protein